MYQPVKLPKSWFYLTFLILDKINRTGLSPIPLIFQKETHSIMLLKILSLSVLLISKIAFPFHGVVGLFMLLGL